MTFEETKRFAERGCVDAQYYLGNMYYKGEGVKAKYAEAVRWWTKAAGQGHVDAKYELENLLKKMENPKWRSWGK